MSGYYVETERRSAMSRKKQFKAIETFYKGCRFRSRLEARWAVFLDSHKCPWGYEKEGFVLDGECYLPDFWLPSYQHEDDPAQELQGYGFWLEVKGQPLTEREQRLCGLLREHTGHEVFAVAGDIGYGKYWTYKWDKWGGLSIQKKPQRAEWWQSDWEFEAEFEDSESNKHRGMSMKSENDFISLLLWRNAKPEKSGAAPIPILRCEHEAIYDKARSARFEHGECPG